MLPLKDRIKWLRIDLPGQKKLSKNLKKKYDLYYNRKNNNLYFFSKAYILVFLNLLMKLKIC